MLRRHTLSKVCKILIMSSNIEKKFKEISPYIKDFYKIDVKNQSIEYMKKSLTLNVAYLHVKKILTDTYYDYIKDNTHSIMDRDAKNAKEIGLDEYTNFIFRTACIYGYIEIAKTLLDFYPNIDVTSDDNSAIKWSCKNNHVEIVNLLLICGYYIWGQFRH